ncbi:TetR/AcrR family transcriptional regulator [Lutimaribacter saemankumensis]|uniref:DNA-binding transcriptional regulator, AcrR family n=1 Tax=Lutimaribacter saemankumensis TaxID=490829 RepID=A0A1G8LG20_9RHOB|nr:TetR/AcrR family transcriptional regulator [Lutimaribacter saemankumensis]SDI54160.1 DNA-binding transcriptional regulator, AcrR family [Lutimaribacter saemankumensis]
MSRDSSETKSRILNATWKLLESGDNAVRMSDIAKAVGISRQALYLHYPNRADLLVATTKHIDTAKNIDARLERSRSARTGGERLDAFIEAWGGYIPEIHGISVALRAMRHTDREAAEAWDGRMQAVRHGCAAAVRAIAGEGRLPPGLTPERATDLLWMLLSVENWERLVRDCGWSQADYEKEIKALARAELVVTP